MRFPVPRPVPTTAPDVVGFGENSIDIVALVDVYPPPDSKEAVRRRFESPGGQTATALVAASRLGLKARYVGSVGHDAHGEEIIRILEREGLDVIVRRVDARTRSALVIVDLAGHRTVLEDRDAGLNWPAVELNLADVTAGRALLVDGTDLEASIAAATAARNAGVLTMVDVDRPAPGIDRLLRVIDVVVVPESFALAFTGARDVGEALQRLEQGFQPALAVATLGARGALARCADVEIRSPGFRVEVVDSTGAGDAFRGGLLAGWLTSGGEADVEDVLEYANAVAALACTGLGAQSALPREPAVRALVTGSAVARSN